MSTTIESPKDPAPDLSLPEDGEGDVCRVCRAEGDEEMPLIYPCKCSGSVRYVHADCLKSWLAHSQKRYCEICGYKYAFTKVYPEDVPSSIPFTVYIRQSALAVTRAISLALRFVMVVTSWLITLPIIEMFVLRGGIYFTDSITDPSEGGFVNELLGNTTVLNSTSAADETLLDINSTASTTDHLPLTARILLHIQSRVGSDQTFPGFVFRGQILSISLAGLLLAIMLLREWFLQHNWTEHLNPKPKPTIQDVNPDDYFVTCGISFKNDQKAEAKEFVDELVATKKAVPTGRLGVGRRRAAGREVMVRMAREAQRRRGGELESESESGLESEQDQEQEQDQAKGSEILTKQEMWVRDLQNAVDATSEQSTTTINGSGRAFGSDAFPRKVKKVKPDVLAVVGPSDGSATLESSDAKRDTDTANVYSAAGPSRTRPVVPLTSPSSSPERGSVRLTSPPLLSPDSGLPRPADIARTPSLAYKAPEMLSEKAKGKRKEEDGEGGGVDPGTDGAAIIPASTEDVVVEGLQDVLEKGHDDEEGWEDMNDEEGREIIMFPPADPGGTNPFRHEAGDVPASPTPSDSTSPNSRPPTPLDPHRYRPLEELPEALLNAPGVREIRHLPAEDQMAILDEVRRLADEGRLDELRQGRGGRGRLRLPREDADVQVDFIDDDLDGPFDREDWDGILEVVGLIGPISNLFQNVLFASVIIAAAQIIFIGLPMICGKLFLCTDVIGVTMWFTRNTLRAIRLVTNPIVDVTLEIARDVILKPALSSARGLEGVVTRKLGITLPSTPDFSFLQTSFSAESSNNSTLSIWVSSISTRIQEGNSQYHCLSQLIPTPASTSGRAISTLTGYVLAASVITITVLANKLGIIDYTWGFLRGEGRQYALFGKLASFMAVELVVFPLCIGVILGGCVTPLFEGGALTALLGMFRERVFGGVFLAWLSGTMFMYSFATFLSYIRVICRPGALYFIRDPSDPSYSPVKDIIDRPTGSQARKLWSSGVLYTAVVFWLFGGTCWGLSKQGIVDVLPLRYKGYAPVSSVPFDILFLYLVVPPTLSSLRLFHRGKKLLAIWWYHTATLCRLGPLLLTNPSHDSPLSDPAFLSKLWPAIDPIFQLFFGKYTSEATYMRVPCSDRVALLPTTQRRREGVFIPLTDEGEPRTDLIKKALIRQDLRAVEQDKLAKEDYTIVWMPAYWRTRLHVFIGCAMSTCAGVLGWGFFGPILVGRAVWGMVLEHKFHDGYSFVVGWYVILGAFWVGRYVGRYITRMNRAPRIRRSIPSMRSKRLMFTALSDLYTVGMVFGITPLLIGLVWDLYVTIPGKYGYMGEGRPVIHVWDSWSMGLVLLCLQAGILGVLSRQRTGAGRLADLRRCIRHPLGRRFDDTNRILLPVLGVLTAQILVPQFMTFVLYLLVPPADHIIAGTSRTMYVNYLAVLLLVGGRGWMAKKWETLRQGMVDREYVLEEKVENYEPEEVVEVVSGDAGTTLPETVQGDGSVVGEDDAESPDDVEAEEDSDGVSGADTPAQTHSTTTYERPSGEVQESFRNEQLALEEMIDTVLGTDGESRTKE